MRRCFKVKGNMNKLYKQLRLGGSLSLRSLAAGTLKLNPLGFAAVELSITSITTPT